MNIKINPKFLFPTQYWEVELKENMLLVFPSWVPHAVETNLSDEDRISLSFNFILSRSLP